MSPESIATSANASTIVLGFVAISFVLTFLRLLRGPFLPDRVVALETTSMLSVGGIAAYAIETGQQTFLDVAIVMALITFLGTIAFARYLEKGEQRHE
jgi:multicomponent Na+:H+ antiporter subunit F